MINLLWKWNANLTQQCPSPEMVWETRALSILAALPPTLTPGLPWPQAAKPGDHGHPVLVPENAVPLVLLEQTISMFLIGALRAVWGKGTKPPVSHGLSGKIKCPDRAEHNAGHSMTASFHTPSVQGRGTEKTEFPHTKLFSVSAMQLTPLTCVSKPSRKTQGHRKRKSREARGRILLLYYRKNGVQRTSCSVPHLKEGSLLNHSININT